MSRLIDADEIFYDQLLNTGHTEHPLEFAVSKKRIDDMPTIEPQQKKGKWIATHERGLFSHPDSITYVCSECGNKIYTVYGLPQKTRFCWDCGALMEGGESDGS